MKQEHSLPCASSYRSHCNQDEQHWVCEMYSVHPSSLVGTAKTLASPLSSAASAWASVDAHAATLSLHCWLPKKNVDLVVEVVNENEWLTALQFVSLRCKYIMPKRGACYYGRMKESDGEITDPAISVILVRTFDAGSFHSASILEDVLQLFTPRAVFGIGCAFGMDEVEFGDVMVSEIISSYEAVREGTSADGDTVVRENRNPPIQMVENLRKSIQSMSPWRLQSKLEVSQSGGAPTVKIGAGPRLVGCKMGAMLCGEKLIDNKTVRDDKLDLVSSKHSGEKPKINGTEIIGGEMEGTGIASVCIKYNGIPCAIVKGKSDGADGQKNTKRTEAVDGNGAKQEEADESDAVKNQEKAAKKRFKQVTQRAASYAAWHFVRSLVTSTFSSIKHYSPQATTTSSVPVRVRQHDPLWECGMAYLKAAKDEMVAAKAHQEESAKHNETMSNNEERQKLMNKVETEQQKFDEYIKEYPHTKHLETAKTELAEFDRQHAEPSNADLLAAEQKKQEAQDDFFKKVKEHVLPHQRLKDHPLVFDAGEKKFYVSIEWSMPHANHKANAELYMDPTTHRHMSDDILHQKQEGATPVSCKLVEPTSSSSSSSSGVSKRLSLSQPRSKQTAKRKLTDDTVKAPAAASSSSSSASSSFGQSSSGLESEWIECLGSDAVKDYKYVDGVLHYRWRKGNYEGSMSLTKKELEEFEKADSKGKFINQRRPSNKKQKRK